MKAGIFYYIFNYLYNVSKYQISRKYNTNIDVSIKFFFKKNDRRPPLYNKKMQGHYC